MEASRQAARYLQELDSVNREQKADQDRLDNELRRKGEFDNKHRQKVGILFVWITSRANQNYLVSFVGVMLRESRFQLLHRNL